MRFLKGREEMNKWLSFSLMLGCDATRLLESEETKDPQVNEHTDVFALVLCVDYDTRGVWSIFCPFEGLFHAPDAIGLC